jgi:hypothetical protein
MLPRPGKGGFQERATHFGIELEIDEMGLLAGMKQTYC